MVYPDEVCNVNMKPIYVQNQQSNDFLDSKNNLFDLTFGEFERMWSMAVYIDKINPCDPPNLKYNSSKMNDAGKFFPNYFFYHLNATYINTKYMYCKNFKYFGYSEISQTKFRKFYKELETDYKAIDSETR